MTGLLQNTKRTFISLLFIVLVCSSAYAQRVSNNSSLSVFLDLLTTSVDGDYVRQEIPIVVYVRDKEHSDVHIIISRHSSGTTGHTYNISFIGYGNYEDKKYELKFWAPSTNTSHETREGYTKTIKMGLAPYVAASSLSSKMSVFYDTTTFPDDEEEEVRDPWNYWVFESYGGYSLNKEETRSTMQLRYGFFGDRITRESKIRLRPYGNYYERKFYTDKGTIISTRVRGGFHSYYIKSIGDHIGVGTFGTIFISTYDNLKFSGDISPAIEYSLFPYDQATRRSITLAWRLGGGYYDYVEETIFDQTEEFLFGQALVLSSDFRQPWGTIRAGLTGFHHFHDFNSNRAEVFANINFRIVAGLALNVSSSYELINDQMAIPKADLSLEQILLEQRRRATSYKFGVNIGLSYTFGSQITGFYNPRLN